MTLVDAVNEFPVRLGSMLFTLIEAHPGHERDYNRWYERDHIYGGCLVGPWNFAGARWLATRDLKVRRLPADSVVTGGDNSRGSFLSMYWIHEGHHGDWGAWAGRTVHELHADGRMFEEREHVHTKLYAFDWAVGRDPDGVPIELALDRRFPGLVVVVGEASGDPAAADAWFRDEALPAALPGSAAALVARFSLMRMPSNAPGVPTEEGADQRFLQLWFLDEEPGDAFDALLPKLAEDFAASGLGEIVFASPFRPTVPGTDTHLDNL